MSVEAFLDTNVLVYAASGHEADAAKRETALGLIDDLDFGLSAQVLQEFYVTVVHKAEIPISADEALEWLEQFEAFPCQAIEPSIVKLSAEMSQRYQISYWDGAILAAAEALGAQRVLSEDLNDGQNYGSVRVVNPFRKA